MPRCIITCSHYEFDCMIIYKVFLQNYFTRSKDMDNLEVYIFLAVSFRVKIEI